MNSDEYKNDNEDERLRKLKKKRRFDNEIDLLKRNGYSAEELLDKYK